MLLRIGETAYKKWKIEVLTTKEVQNYLVILKQLMTKTIRVIDSEKQEDVYKKPIEDNAARSTKEGEGVDFREQENEYYSGEHTGRRGDRPPERWD